MFRFDHQKGPQTSGHLVDFVAHVCAKSVTVYILFLSQFFEFTIFYFKSAIFAGYFLATWFPPICVGAGDLGPMPGKELA